MNPHATRAGRATPSAADQRGATLIEVLMTLAIAAMVIAPLMAWAVASFRHQEDSKVRNRETAAVALLTTSFQRDASTASFARSEAQSGGAGANCSGVTGEDVLVVFSTTADGGRRVVYSTAADTSADARPNTVVLRRHVCNTDLSATSSSLLMADLDGASAQCPANSGTGQNDACWTVRLTVDPRAGRTATIDGVRRVDALNPMRSTPTARFTHSPLRAERGVPVSFNAGMSWDPIDQPLTYSWNWGDGTPDTTTSDPLTTHTFDAYAPGGQGFPFTVTLTVTSPSGSDTTSSQIAVLPRRPSASAISFSTPVPRGVGVVYSSTIAAGDSTSLQCTWNWGEGAPETVPCSAGTHSRSHTYATVGTRLVQLTVTGESGDARARAAVSVSNAPPVVSAVTTSPNPIRRGNAMQLAATATSTTGTIARIEIDWGDGTANTTRTCSSGATCSFTGQAHTYATRGSYAIRLTAYDDLNVASVVFVRNITVLARVPVATFTTNPDASQTAPSTGPRTVAATPDVEAVDVASYAWTIRSFPDLTWSSTSTTRAPSFANLPVGNYVLELTVVGLDDPAVTWSKRLLLTGTPGAPGAVTKVNQGCCATFGDFSFAVVPGADTYEVRLDGFFLGGCVSDHSGTTSFSSPAAAGRYTARVAAAGLCLGSRYDVSVRARVAGGSWGPWSSSVRVTL